MPVLAQLEHALETTVRIVRVRIGHEQLLVRAARAIRIAILELGGELAQGRELLALRSHHRESLHRA